MHYYLQICLIEQFLSASFCTGGLGMTATQMARAAELIGSTDLSLSVTLGAHQVRYWILLINVSVNAETRVLFL